MTHAISAARKRFLAYFRKLIEEMGEDCPDVDLLGWLCLNEKKVRVPTPSLPLQLHLGGEQGFRLHLDPEVIVDEQGRFGHSGDFLLFEPESYFSSISGFYRLSVGESLTLGCGDQLQRDLLAGSDLVEQCDLRLKLTHKGLALHNKSTRVQAGVAPLATDERVERMQRWRRRKIEQLADVIKAPIECPSRSEGLDLLERVITLMGHEAYRTPRKDGRPGGLLELPAEPAPIFVGDLHGCINNLLVILSQNRFLESLRDGSAALILLGDAAQPDVPGQEHRMEHSMLLMDLIFRLKLLFPKQVFYLRGNHDSFSSDISKGGVSQGLLWEKALVDQRGARYRDAMQEFYDLLPYALISPQYICCHAGAPTMKVSREDLIHVHDHPKLQHQLTHIRLRKAGGPSGYGRSDVRRLRQRVGLSSTAPFIVGHTPLSDHETYWLNVGDIEGHHVLSGANQEKIGVITRLGQHLRPLHYPVEPLLPVYNRLVHTGKLSA